MRTTWMGAAVAAVMVCGAGVQSAKAALVPATTYDVSFSYFADYAHQVVYHVDGLVNFVNGDLSASSVDFRYYNSADMLVDEITEAPLTFLTYSNTGAAIDFSAGAGRYDASFTQAANGTSTGCVFAVGCSSDATLTVTTGTISAVPLPSSAPLFGAALIALGGIGYARRRGSVRV